MAHLYRVLLPVSDIEKAAQFYSRLFGQEGERVSPGRHYFNLQGTILACFDPRADGDDFDAQPNPQYIYFAVEDLDKSFEFAKSLEFSKLDDNIEKMPWGERLFYGADPFGNPICLVDQATKFTGGGF